MATSGHVTERWIVVGVVGVLLGTPARAAVVGTGTMSVDVVPPPAPTYSASVTFADATYDLFGTPVNLGEAGGVVEFAGAYTLDADARTGTFTGTMTSSPPDAFVGTLEGTFVNFNCPPPPEICANTSFLATFTSLSGTVPAAFPPGLTYRFDGTLTLIAVDAVVHSVGDAVISAFAPETIPTSPVGCSGVACQVFVVVPPTTIVNSGTGQAVTVSAHLTFPLVTDPGTTTVSAVSNVAAQLSSNFSFSETATFIDISTTATVDTSGGPIVLCLNYDIVGTNVDPTLLRLLHVEAGTWVDVTTSVDPSTHTICGEVLHLSPFGIATFSPACTTAAECDDGDPCSLDACPAGTCTHVLTPQPACSNAPSGSAKLTMVNKAGGKGTVAWRWGKGAVTASDLGDPTGTTGYALCVYDQVPAHTITLALPGGGSCGSKPCWKAAGSAFKYADKTAAADGIYTATFKTAAAPKGGLRLKAKGPILRLPRMPPTGTVTVQLKSTAGGCWQGSFVTPIKNDPTHFKAVSN